METWQQIAIFLSVFTLAIVTPGPNFVLVVNSALGESRRHGLVTACGVATGSGLFALAGLLGLIVLVTSWPPVAGLLRFAGGGYLVWIGIDMLRRLRRPVPHGVAGPPLALVSLRRAYRRGLVTNLTNPKAWAFYISLFTLLLDPAFPLWGKGVLNLAMFLISLAWYALMALLVSDRRFRARILAWQPLVEGALGLTLVAFGGRVLLGL